MNAITKPTPGQSVAAALKPNGAAPASQATTIEQSRAVAEVQAMVVVAQRVPRNLHTVRTAIRASCSEMGMAEEAFWKFPRGGKTLTGETIHLAVELARCWGNINYGISELSRDDTSSEMLAFAWDVETNARAMTSFIVPHRRDKSEGGGDLTSMRDIYENNANMGSRRLREMIFRVIPKWITSEAVAICFDTIEGNDKRPLAERIAAMVEAFEKIGVPRARLEAKIGNKASQFTVMDVTHLRVSYMSIRRGEITIDEEFPVTAATAVIDALQPSTAGNPTAPADASGGAASTSSPTPPEATQPQTVGDLLDKMPPPAGAPVTFDAQVAAEDFLLAIEGIKVLRGLDTYVANQAHTLEQIKSAFEESHAFLMSKVAERRKALGGK